MQSDVELNAEISLTELRGLLSGNTEQFGQFLIKKSKEWNFTIKELLGAFEQLNAEFSTENKANKEVFRKVRKYLIDPISAKNAHTETTKTLSSEDANKLASIIAKYIDLDNIGEMTGIDFAYELFSKMEEDEITYVSSLFIEDITKIEPSEIIELCVKGMIKSNLFGLLETYRLGLANNG